MKSQLAIARDQYLDGKGITLWINAPPVGRMYARNCVERAWIDGVTYGVQASVDNRCKVAAPGWLKGKP